MGSLSKEQLQLGQDQQVIMLLKVHGGSEISQDLSELYTLQTEFENTLKLTHDTEELLHSSYNPVTDRWHIEQLRKKGDIHGLQSFREELWNNKRTNLMERLHAVESYGEFTISGGQLYSKEFPEKPFGQIIKRGAVYRAQFGSPEQEREGERGEGGGWEYINGKMADESTPVGTTILSLSPPGIVPNTAYEGKYVDKYMLLENLQGRYVKRARIAVGWDFYEYKNQAISLKSDFFTEYDGRPIDAWFLSHPIVVGNIVLESSEHGMSPGTFSSIFEHPTLQRLIKQYERNVFSESTNWLDIAFSFNAILNCADELKQGQIDSKRYQTPNTLSVHQIASMDEESFHAAVYLLGARPVATVGGGGCPPNRGINLSSIVTTEGGLGNNDSGILSNSVAKFGTIGSESCNKISCKKCNWEANDEEVAEIQKGQLMKCPKCGWSPT